MLIMHTKYTIYYVWFPHHHLFTQCTHLQQQLLCEHYIFKLLGAQLVNNSECDIKGEIVLPAINLNHSCPTVFL